MNYFKGSKYYLEEILTQVAKQLLGHPPVPTLPGTTNANMQTNKYIQTNTPTQNTNTNIWPKNEINGMFNKDKLTATKQKFTKTSTDSVQDTVSTI